MIKHRRTLEVEKKLRKQTGDQKTDFVDYLEFLVQLYKILTRLDAAGFTLQHVFGDNKMSSDDELLEENESPALSQEEASIYARK